MPTRRLGRATLAMLSAPLILGAGCSSGDDAPNPAVRRSPQSLISDQLHNGGTNGFIFLPPMVPRPAQMGDFIPNVNPTVRIDEVTAAGATLRTLATFTATTGPNRERIRIHYQGHPCDPDDDDGDADPEGYFLARWKTNNANLSTSARYRVRVFVPAAGGGTREIGFADVDVVRNQQEFRTVDTVNFSPLIDGRVLRIKFRIDRPAVDRDNDGVFDWVDNCPSHANANQLDSNHDGQGNACECVGVTCTASDACHSAGACNPANGMCSNPNAPNGTACSLPGAAAVCTNGACGVASCNAGGADCNGTAADGCETSTRTLTNCGTCGTACASGPHSTPSCATGTCSLTCDAGWADANGDRTDGCELDITTDANCGSPGNACTSGTGGTTTCVGGACSTMACAPGRANCNTSIADGCEVSLTDSATHCGACGHACSVLNAAPACVGGECAVGACNPGHLDCDGSAANGCEVTPATDVSNCGGCGTACSLDHASAVCAGGSCAVGACAPGFANCNAASADGCETDLAGVANCGACGNTCDLPHATPVCAAGACAVGTCSAGWADCNGDPADGCEVDLSSVSTCGSCNRVCPSGPHAVPTCGWGTCGITCDTGWGDCDGNPSNGCEVDTSSAGSHCGACGTVCGNATTCVSGACSTAVCVSGHADCNGLPGDGCETTPASDAGHCGACGHACSFANAAPQCVDGACGFAVCDVGFADCDGQQASGCEVALGTDANHCGGCGNVCTYAHATGVCGNGTCALGACDPGWADCNGNPADGCEASLTADLNHCGVCGTACASVPNATATCDGTCGYACDPAHADCDLAAGNGCEVDTRTSIAHCGACGNVCTQGRTCVAGACTAMACTAPLANCDGAELNGCEVDTTTDAAHCGTCGNACSFAHAAASCANGVCAMGACNPGFANCDGNPANGCEVELGSDADHCGTCGTVCTAANGTPSCVNGACRVASCDPGHSDCDNLPGNGCEVSTTTDTAHCGACDNACPALPSAVATCASSVCGFQCVAGRRNCDNAEANGCEVDVSADNANCGACGNVCTQGRTCVSGQCSVAVCATGAANCDGDEANGCEVALASNTSHCGTCGNACSYPNGSGVCTAGSCSLGACTAGFRNCNAVSADGCETNVTSSTAHCGTCGFVCSAPNGTPACTAGQCAVASCNAGFANCDGNASNGCEVTLASNTAHCGQCGNACPVGNTCQSGACVPAGATWLLNDGCGSTTAADSSGNNNTGTLANGPRWQSGSSCHDGACLLFDGVDDRVTAPYGASLKFGTRPFSVVAWVRTQPGANAGREVVVVGANRCFVSESWLLNMYDGFPSLSTFGTGSAGAQSSVRVNDGAWHLLVGRRNGTSLQLLVDGVVRASATVSAAWNSDAGGTLLTMGNLNGCGGREFSGRVDDVRVVDRSLTDAEVAGLNGPNATTPDTSTDPNNCGGCGFTCGAVANGTPGCSAGTCGVGACNAGFGNCDGNGANGCETNVTNSTAHCGACGSPCASGNSCQSGQCVPNPRTWTAYLNAASSGMAGRAYHTAVWTGTQMIVWGGTSGGENGVGGTHFADGAIYTPATNTWQYLAAGAANAPSARFNHTAVWTGTRMIIWGGLGGSTSNPATLGNGASYDPVTDTWTAIPAGVTNAPAARYGHTATWTGTQMIVWGGSSAHYFTNSQNVVPAGGMNGGIYDPTTGAWTVIPNTALPSLSTRRINHTAVWTGTQLIVWGGHGSCTQLGDGGVFTPATNTWQYLPAGATNAPGPRGQHTAVWTGTQMLVWGGGTYANYGDGASYNPTTGAWTYHPGNNYGATDAPQPNQASFRMLHTAVWTGTQMVVWGGQRYCGGCGPSVLCSYVDPNNPNLNGVKGDGGVFNPVSNTWSYVSLTGTNAPGLRTGHSVVWTGTRMIVWGGMRNTALLSDGAVFNP